MSFPYGDEYASTDDDEFEILERMTSESVTTDDDQQNRWSSETDSEHMNSELVTTVNDQQNRWSSETDSEHEYSKEELEELEAIICSAKDIEEGAELLKNLDDIVMNPELDEILANMSQFHLDKEAEEKLMINVMADVAKEKQKRDELKREYKASKRLETEDERAARNQLRILTLLDADDSSEDDDRDSIADDDYMEKIEDFYEEIAREEAEKKKKQRQEESSASLQHEFGESASAVISQNGADNQPKDTQRSFVSSMEHQKKSSTSDRLEPRKSVPLFWQHSDEELPVDDKPRKDSTSDDSRFPQQTKSSPDSVKPASESSRAPKLNNAQSVATREEPKKNHGRTAESSMERQKSSSRAERYPPVEKPIPAQLFLQHEDEDLPVDDKSKQDWTSYNSKQPNQTDYSRVYSKLPESSRAPNLNYGQSVATRKEPEKFHARTKDSSMLMSGHSPRQETNEEAKARRAEEIRQSEAYIYEHLGAAAVNHDSLVHSIYEERRRRQQQEQDLDALFDEKPARTRQQQAPSNQQYQYSSNTYTTRAPSPPRALHPYLISKNGMQQGVQQGAPQQQVPMQNFSSSGHGTRHPDQYPNPMYGGGPQSYQHQSMSQQNSLRNDQSFSHRDTNHSAQYSSSMPGGGSSSYPQQFIPQQQIPQQQTPQEYMQHQSSYPYGQSSLQNVSRNVDQNPIPIHNGGHQSYSPHQIPMAQRANYGGPAACQQSGGYPSQYPNSQYHGAQHSPTSFGFPSGYDREEVDYQRRQPQMNQGGYQNSPHPGHSQSMQLGYAQSSQASQASQSQHPPSLPVIKMDRSTPAGEKARMILEFISAFQKVNAPVYLSTFFAEPNLVDPNFDICGFVEGSMKQFVSIKTKVVYGRTEYVFQLI